MADEEEQNISEEPSTEGASKTEEQPSEGNEGATQEETAEEPSKEAGAAQGEDDSQEALDQSAIDAMLGDTFAGSSVREESGIERVIKTGFVAYERMPMLENVFDRFVRFLSSKLLGFTNDTVDITLESMRSLRFGDYMQEVPSSSVFNVFKAEQWKNYGLLIFDASLSYSIVDILMGGQRGSKLKIIENRPPTALERALIEKLATISLTELSEAFVPVGDINLHFERLEISSSFATIVRPSNAAVTARFHVDMGDRSGNMDLILPYATLEPVREKLSQQFMGENFGSDSAWEDYLISEIMETSITMSTVFEETYLPLSQILDLKKGSVLHLPHKRGAPYQVQMECDDTPMFIGTLGKANNMQVVRIDQRLIPPEDEIHTAADLGIFRDSTHKSADQQQ
ncbi:flagellar motor switch protein FliM [Saccharibacter floricola]|uniref:Flagellar motor switch protein FliM n=1 Tax=Saccharibacter floricola DSM 15669 TaxID=1123227 RepID=A0ABQ0P103_9PROT|nr:flagellar motor switch protein FliM [Saccharibacter floricola]GBQ05900.1 flagellar motor switch protein FliM [Saccharibacter floricola DSM 15669]